VSPEPEAASLTAGRPGASRPAGQCQEGPALTPGRWELLRALGFLTLGRPGESSRLAVSLGLHPWTAAEHTRAFVLALPPYASIYLGQEGKLGGEAADRVAGVWRATGLIPPGDADHLAAILALYGELGEMSQSAASQAARDRLAHLRSAVLWEHLVPWVPPYLAAIRRDPPFAPWASLLDRALLREMALSDPPGGLPLALRDAPGGLAAEGGYGDLLDALTAPARAGFILTHDDLGAAARQAGVGLRRGERRFALAAMIEQDPAATLAWLSEHARHWACLHRLWSRRRPGIAGAADPARWWERRARSAVTVLRGLADAARAAGPAGG